MKGKKLLLIPVLLLIAAQNTQPSSTGRDIAPKTQTCGSAGNFQGDVNCTIGANAVGDQVAWNVDGSTATPLNVGKTMISFPRHGQKTLYTFTPKTGIFANQTMQVLFVGFSLIKPLPAGTPTNIAGELETLKRDKAWAGAAIKIYRRILPEKQFTELGMAYTANNDLSVFETAEVTLQPNGKAKIFGGTRIDPQTGQPKPINVEVDLSAIF